MDEDKITRLQQLFDALNYCSFIEKDLRELKQKHYE